MGYDCHSFCRLDLSCNSHSRKSLADIGEIKIDYVQFKLRQKSLSDVGTALYIVGS